MHQGQAPNTESGQNSQSASNALNQNGHKAAGIHAPKASINNTLKCEQGNAPNSVNSKLRTGTSPSTIETLRPNSCNRENELSHNRGQTLWQAHRSAQHSHNTGQGINECFSKVFSFVAGSWGQAPQLSQRLDANTFKPSGAFS